MDFIVIANAWSAAKDNPTSKHRIAFELAGRGHNVLWVEGAGMRAPSLGSGHDRLRMVKKIVAALGGGRRAEVDGVHLTGSIWVLSPLFIPLPRYECVRRLNGLICRLGARFWTMRLGLRDPVLINYVPVLAEAMRDWPREARTAESGSRTPRVIYHCVDRWDAFKMYDSSLMAEMDRRCCVYADLVIASATELLERCRLHNAETVLITHGVDYEHFSRAVGGNEENAGIRGEIDEELARRGVPIGHGAVGFFGLLSEWVDQDLLVTLAQAIPEAHIVLIGTADVPVMRLQQVRNIHLLGPRPFKALPHYIARFHVGIIPFVVNDLTRSVNPIKLREMLSAGCPVVSTALPEVEKYVVSGDGRNGWAGESMGVSVAHDAEEFVRLVQAAFVRPLTVEQRRRLAYSMRGETWAAKVGEILALIERPASRKGTRE